MTDFEKWQDKKSERKRSKKLQQKEKKELDKKQGARSAKEVEKEAKEKAQLEMLIDDTEAKSKAKQLEKVSSDPRFDSIIAKDNKYAVDPTHKEYRKVV